MLPRATRAAENTVIKIWPEGVPGLRAGVPPEATVDGRVFHVSVPTLTVYAPPDGKASGTGVIVCPGGAYLRLAMAKEGAGAAHWLNSIGVTAFVLKYRLDDYGHPAPLRDVLRAVRLVRSRAAEFGLKPDRIGVLGASAGGHLAACAGTLYDSPEGKTGAPLDAVSARPDFLVLMYPVITMQPPYAHAVSRRALLGPKPTPALVDHLSMELQVTAGTPPTFIVHTGEDKSVPVENSLMFYAALRKAGVPAELQIYEKGPHGFGFRTDLGPTSGWPQACEAWLRFHGWLD